MSEGTTTSERQSLTIAEIVNAFDAMAKQTPVLAKIEVNSLDYFRMRVVANRAQAEACKDGLSPYLGPMFRVDVVVSPTGVQGRARLIDGNGDLMKEISV
jgi:hypothetical protein